MLKVYNKTTNDTTEVPEGYLENDPMGKIASAQGWSYDNPKESIKTEVGMIDSSSAINQVNKQNDYLNQTYPTLPPTQTPQQPAQQPTAQGKAYYTNQAGQEFEYSQDELNDPTIQQQIKDLGLALAKKDAGVNISSTDKMSGLKSEYDASVKEIEDLKNDIQSWNVDQDPEFQSQTNQIKADFDKLRREMEKTNSQRQRAYETLGYRTGATQYAGGIQMGIEGEELRQGSERLNEITRQESATISAARTAFKTGKWEEFNNQVNLLKDTREQKATELTNYNKAIADYTKKLSEQSSKELDNLYKQMQIQKMQQEVVQTNADTYASSLLTIDPTTGEVTIPDDQTLMNFSEQSGIPLANLQSSARTKAYELSKLSGEDRQRELNLIKTQQDLIPQLFQEYQYAQENLGFAGTWQDFVKSKQQADASVPSSYREWQLAGGESGTGKTYAEYLGSSNGLDSKILTRVGTIANSFDNEPIVKNYNTVQEGFQTISNIGVNTNSPADDIAFIYAFAKIMDPNSVVREGEYNTIQKYAQTWADNFGFKAKRIFSNTNFLTPDAKQKMLNALQPKVDTISQQYDNVYNEYGRRIDKQTGQTDGADYLTQYKIESKKTVQDAVDDYYTKNPDKQKYIDQMTQSGKTDEEMAQILGISFSQVGGDTNTATVKKVSSIKDGTTGGQCGHFVNKLTGLGVQDSYKSKLALVDKSIKQPQPGMVFVMPTNGDTSEYGHVGIILSVNNGVATVKDSNWNGDEKVTTHKIPVSKMTGFTYA